MPYIHFDYSQKHLTPELLKQLTDLIMSVSAKEFGYTDEQVKEFVSILTVPFNEHDHSVAAAEIEVRANIKEFNDEKLSREEVREQKMEGYKQALTNFITDNNLQAGIVFTISFSDWSVTFLPKSEK